MKEYTPMRHIFPDGLQGLRGRVANMPFAAHNRYWAYDTVYKKNYSFALDEKKERSLPIGNDSFWLDLLTQTHGWGQILYEQDWLNEEIYNFKPLYTDIHLGHQWLTSMGQAANTVGMNLQYCMSLPRHLLTALEVPRVTQASASADYADHLQGTTQQWAMGMAPFKDVFWSTSLQPGSPYKNA